MKKAILFTCLCRFGLFFAHMKSVYACLRILGHTHAPYLFVYGCGGLKMALNPNPNPNSLLENSLTAWTRGGPPTVRTQLLFSLERKGEQSVSTLSCREPGSCQQEEARD